MTIPGRKRTHEPCVPTKSINPHDAEINYELCIVNYELKEMYIFNITYVIPNKRKDSFIEWAKGEAHLAAASDKLRDFKVVTVAAIPGDKDFAKQDEKNFSVQMYFDSVADCRAWNERNFPAFMESYARWHGPNPLFFATILKEL